MSTTTQETATGDHLSLLAVLMWGAFATFAGAFLWASIASVTGFPSQPTNQGAPIPEHLGPAESSALSDDASSAVNLIAGTHSSAISVPAFTSTWEASQLGFAGTTSHSGLEQVSSGVSGHSPYSDSPDTAINAADNRDLQASEFRMDPGFSPDLGRTHDRYLCGECPQAATKSLTRFEIYTQSYIQDIGDAGDLTLCY